MELRSLEPSLLVDRDGITVVRSQGQEALQSRFHLYCAAKPLTAIAAIGILERRGISLGSAIGDVLESQDSGWYPWMASRELTIAAILRHDAGLDLPDAAQILMLDKMSRHRLLARVTPSATRAYSEYVAGFLLEAVCRAVGETVEHAVGAMMVSAGAPCDIFRSTGPIALPVARLSDGREVPMLSEVLDEVGERIGPSFDALMTPLGYASFYRALLLAMCGEDLPGWPSALGLSWALSTPRSEFDRRLRRVSSFSGGLMADLHQLTPNRLSPRTVGHVSGYSGTFGLVDPTRAVGYVFVSNSIEFDFRAISARRSELLEMDLP